MPDIKPILTMDFETDPFAFGRKPEPFACGLYDGKDFIYEWSPSCADLMVERLKSYPPSVIYMHNGGRFDIFFLMRHLGAEMVIINGRIVKCHIGVHEVRDSYALLPFRLSTYKKDDIDIRKLERSDRENNRVEILSYLRGDCCYLHELVSAFREEFGDHLTIGSAAMSQLAAIHPFRRMPEFHDVKFRRRFFFGGRVQCFKSGIVTQPYSMYDVNSMYPTVMKNFRHPAGKSEVDKRITPDTAFVVAEGWNRGAFPDRDKKGINFTGGFGVYSTTRYEWDAAEDLGLFKVKRVLKTYKFSDWICFDGFVDHFFSLRQKAEKNGDTLKVLFYKLILNSAYGKFAQNPNNFADWSITHDGAVQGPGWIPKFSHDQGQYIVWRKATQLRPYGSPYYNVAIGASITGAARSVLMRAIKASVDPIYCDTDSLICRELRDVDLDDKRLGAWKFEGSGDRIAIAGKKMYACFNNDECIKSATKGARLSPDEIVDVARGNVVTFRNIAPTFKLGGDVKFIVRKIRRTV